MKWVKRLLLIILALVFLLGLLVAVGGFFFHRYVQSPEFAKRVSDEASTALGVPVQFERLRLDWGEGISVFHLKVENPTAPAEPMLVSIQKIAVRFNLWTVFSSQPEITSILLDQPELKVLQNDAGQYVLPEFQSSAPNAPSSPPSTPSDSEPTTLSIRIVTLQKGLLQIKNPDQSIKIKLAGVQTDANLNTLGEKGISAHGKLQVEEMILAPKLRATALQIPFRFGENTLYLSDMLGSLYGGRLTGSLEQNLSDAKLPYKMVLQAEGVDVNQALTELADRPGVLSGKLEAKTSWLGPANDPLAISGKGTAEIRNGQLIAVPLFKTLGQILQLNALLQPDFQEIKTEFSVENQIVNLSSFRLKATLFDFSGHGTMGFDQTLNLQVTLGLSPELTRQLPQAAEDRFTPREDGFRTVSFNVTGTAANPQIDLAQQLLKQEAEKIVDKGLDKLKGLLAPKKAKTPPPAFPPPPPTTPPVEPTPTAPAPAVGPEIPPPPTPTP